MFDRGYFITQKETYYIEPETDDVRGRHYIFRESDVSLTSSKCGTLIVCRDFYDVMLIDEVRI